MKDPRLQKIWHKLNAAQVEVVVAADELPKKRRDRLIDALHAVRQAEALIATELSRPSSES